MGQAYYTRIEGLQMRIALYYKDKDTPLGWHIVSADQCCECERQDMRNAAVLFHESDLSFGFDRQYVYVVTDTAPGFISNKRMLTWEKL